MNVYDFTVTTAEGSEQSLVNYAGQVLLIVNTASKCGFTPQYEGLQALYKRFCDRQFSVLGFPCNQFAKQEPGSDAEIQAFCDATYGVTFPVFAKIDVNGPTAHPLYQFLAKAAPGVLGTGRIKWNFTKFLIDRTGQVVARYAPTKTPAAIAAEIDALL